MKFDASFTAESVAKTLSDDIKGKTVIITGVTKNGYGAEVARVLALVGANVILASRELNSIEETAEIIREQAPNANLRYLAFDLASQQAIRSAAAEVLNYPDPVDVLILNAGIMAPPFQKTTEGIESQFAVNHISGFLFTNLIMPKLLESRNPRVVVISSLGHTWGQMRFDDYNFQNGEVYDSWAAYGQSKTANMLFAVELAQRFKNTKLTAFSVQPSGAITGLQKHMTREDYAKFLHGFHPDGRPKGNWARSVGEGSASHIVAGFDPSIRDRSGSCLIDCQVVTDPNQVHPHATDRESAKKLWELSEKLVGQTFNVQ